MARSAVSGTDIPDTGYNLTDSADFDTLSTGAGNGVEIPFSTNTLIYLKNGTGNPATFTIKIPTPAKYVTLGAGETVLDMDVEVADGKTHVLRLKDVMKQSDGKVYIDCDVAGSVLVLG